MKRNLSIRRILLPKDTNHHGAIFGGTILAEIDLAGAVEARMHTSNDVVTRYMNGIEFKHPVQVGDVVSFYTTLVKIGKTSITVKVEIEGSRDGEDAPVAVTATEVVYVTVQPDSEGKLHKVPVDLKGELLVATPWNEGSLGTVGERVLSRTSIISGLPVGLVWGIPGMGFRATTDSGSTNTHTCGSIEAGQIWVDNKLRDLKFELQGSSPSADE